MRQCSRWTVAGSCSKQLISPNKRSRRSRDALYSVARLTMAEVQRAHARIRICDIEVLEERAAICEFEGEMQRDQAEDAALIQLDAWKARKQQ